MGKPGIRQLAAWLGLAFALMSAASSRAVTCTQVGGVPGREVTVRLDILDPASGSIVTPVAPCTQDLVVSGTFSVTGPAVLYDFYIVIDASGSTLASSGADVNGNGIVGDSGDTIYQAEIAAARAFVRALDPSYARVAVIRFNRSATVRQRLSGDLVAVDATLQGMTSDAPRWGTGYVPAMQAVEGEVNARGDRVNRNQRCMFLSDGQPDETLPEVDAAARALDALDVRIDTFALGFVSSPALEDMALVTGGVFTPLVTPGDIVALLPDFVPDVPRTAGSHNELTGGDGDVVLDDASGTFVAHVTLVPGTNHVVLTLTADGAPPVSVSCAIDVVLPESLVADAGPAQSACTGVGVTLDGSASSFGPCASPMYRWLDCRGNEICPPSTSPECNVVACSSCSTYTLEVSCAGAGCTSRSVTTVDCAPPPVIEPALLRACSLVAEIACGGSASATNWWDLDTLIDSNGDGDPSDDVDATGCRIAASFPSAGPQIVTAWSRDDASGCVSTAELRFTLSEPAPPRDLDGGLCPGAVADFSCGTPDPSSTYWWDFDTSVDSDGDGVSDDDVDSFGCDASMSWPAGGAYEVKGWRRDLDACRFVIAAGTLTVDPGALPGEVPDLRVSHDGDAVHFTWGSVPGAATYRLVRGSVASLWTSRAYDHVADSGAGSCDTSAMTEWDDPDDAAGSEGWYYLAIGVSACGGDGPAGNAWDGRSSIARPPRMATTACP